MQSAQTILPTGAVVQGRYVVEDLLGKGGFGAVYLVRDRKVKQNLFALKEVIAPNKQERDRFTRECDLLRRLDYPALPRVYYVFDDNKKGRAYMLMDYVEGPNLEILRQRQPDKRLPLSQVLKVLTPIVGAITYLHNQDPPIIHRDIKPANIVVPIAGDEAVLVDFGIAKEHTPDDTTTAIRRGSPGYAAPELYALGTDLRTDIYELGATCYALLTGVVPADSVLRVTQVGSRGTDPLELANQVVPAIPQPVAEAIMRAMSLRIDDRYPTIGQFWQAMNADPAWREEPEILTLSLDAPQPSNPVAPHKTTSVVLPRREKARLARPGRLGLLIVAILITLTGLTVGASLLSSTAGSAMRPTPFVQHTATVAVTATSRPTTTPTLSALPTLAATYAGSIHNTPADVTSTMSLTSIKQNGGDIHGFLILGPGLLGNGPLAGSVTAARRIQFTVPGFSGHGPLHFFGAIQGDGSLKGSYCSLDQTNQCNPSAGGYGTWNVAPTTS